MSQNRQLLITLAILAAIIFAASGRAYAEDAAKVIELPGDSAYPESIAASPDGTLYVSSLASGGIIRIQPGAANAEVWIRVSILGDLAVIETIKAGLGRAYFRRQGWRDRLGHGRSAPSLVRSSRERPAATAVSHHRRSARSVRVSRAAS
jgi:hypothetical protein